MKAIVLTEFGSSDNFTALDVAIPDVREGEVRIKVKAVSFNPVDYQIRMRRSESSYVRSMILGRDLSGIVDAVHNSVTSLTTGDDVMSYVCNLASSGTYAEYVSVPAELVARKPLSLTYEQAAAVPVAGITACLALGKAAANKSKSLFIAGGAGGVGTMAIFQARRLGVSNLCTTAGSKESRAYLIEKCGLREDQIVNYHERNFVDQAIARTSGGFDVALDLVGGKMLSACCALLAVDGNLASVTEAPSEEDFEILFTKNASFHSVGAHAYSLRMDRSVWQKYREMLEQLSRDFDGGLLIPPPINVIGTLTPEVVRQAHRFMEVGGVQGKLVMTC
jgi:NADPH:quinone reductase